jgi:hypothetical protein
MFHVEPGDIIQLQFPGMNRFSHSLMINDIKRPVRESSVFVTTHDRDCFHYPLSEYVYANARFIKITGVQWYEFLRPVTGINLDIVVGKIASPNSVAEFACV